LVYVSEWNQWVLVFGISVAHTYEKYPHNSEEQPMQSRFLIKQNDAQEFFFNFVNQDNEVILLSANYPDMASAKKAIEDVKLNSLMSQQLAAGKTPNGEQFFAIKGSDGSVVTKSVLYTSQMLMDNALHCVKDNACVAEIDEVIEQPA
jgi:uncharacterized protein YegP (UPF0339 family)